MIRRPAIVALVTAVLLSLATSSALAGGFYPSWTKTPEKLTAQRYEGTVDFNLRLFPNATWTSVKSVDDNKHVRLYNSAPDCDASGTSCEWMTRQTPYGSVFGASGPSETIRFLSQRADKGTVITTTYTFGRPAPARALGIALGDADVDSVEVVARDASGGAIPLADLVPGAFNFCEVTSDKPDECGDAPYDTPVWSETATGGLLSGTGEESTGPLGWLRPTTGVKTLTLTFRPNAVGSGTPSYRTWLTALGFKVTGQVTTTSGRKIEDVLVSLYGPDGELLDTVRTNSNGGYDFPNFAAGPGYEVRVSPPEGYYPASPTEEGADLSTRDQVVDFKLTTRPEPGPKPDPDPEPIPGPGGTITLNYQDVNRENAFTNLDVPAAGTITQTVSRKVGRRYVSVCRTSRPSNAAEKDILISCRLPASTRRALRCSDQRFRVQLDFSLPTGETTAERRTYVVAKGKCPRPDRKKPAYTG